jgi:hypothetical protein
LKESPTSKVIKFKVLDSGVLGGENQFLSVATELVKVTKVAIVSSQAEAITHWWLLEKEDGGKLVYWGTEETFERFSKGKQ